MNKSQKQMSSTNKNKLYCTWAKRGKIQSYFVMFLVYDLNTYTFLLPPYPDMNITVVSAVFKA